MITNLCVGGLHLWGVGEGYTNAGGTGLAGPFWLRNWMLICAIVKCKLNMFHDYGFVCWWFAPLGWGGGATPMGGGLSWTILDPKLDAY